MVDAKRTIMVSVRLTEAELARVERVVQDVQARQPYAKKSDILREILGVVDTGMITDRERKHLKDKSDILAKRIGSRQQPPGLDALEASEGPATTNKRTTKKGR